MTDGITMIVFLHRILPGLVIAFLYGVSAGVALSRWVIRRGMKL